MQDAARRRADRITPLDEAALYLAIGIALAISPLLAGAGGGSVQIGLVGVILVIAGVIFSWRQRRRGRKGLLAGVSLGITAAAAFNILVEYELSLDESSLTLAVGEVGFILALRMAMLPIAFSFMLVKYDVMAFSLVPSLAIFGLVGGQGSTILVGACFALFLPAALVAMGHGMLLSGITASGLPPAGFGARTGPRWRPLEAGWRLGRWRARHWSALGSTILVIAVIAYLIFLPMAFYMDKYRWQILSAMATGGIGPQPMFFAQSQRASNATLYRVGRGPISPSPEVLLTIWGQPAPLWRGQIFDHFTGHTWLRSESTPEEPLPLSDQTPAARLLASTGQLLDIADSFPPEPAGVRAEPGTSLPTHVVRIEKRLPLVFYSPGQIQQLSGPGLAGISVFRVDAYGCVESPDQMWRPGDSYQVVSAPLEIRHRPRANQPLPAPRSPPHTGGSTGPADSLPRSYLKLPFGSRRVADLARKVAGSQPTPQQKLAALIAHLQQNYVYTLKAPATPPGRDAADYFLFHSKRGYCDLFATSLALMGRAIGIPTRFADGFAYGSPPGGEKAPRSVSSRPVSLRSTPTYPTVNASGDLQMRASDAHTWVEAYIEPWGWVAADATPVGGQSPISPLRRSLFQVRFILQDHLVAVLIVTVALALALVLKLRRVKFELPKPFFSHSEARFAVVRAYAQLLVMLRRRGQARRPSQTPLEFLAQLRAPQTPAGAASESKPDPALGAAMPAISSLTDLFLVARYSSSPVAEAEVHVASQQLALIRRQLRRSRGL